MSLNRCFCEQHEKKIRYWSQIFLVNMKTLFGECQDLVMLISVLNWSGHSLQKGAIIKKVKGKTSILRTLNRFLERSFIRFYGILQQNLPGTISITFHDDFQVNQS